ncbi:hypothetical protein TCAL_15296 [Tigriopus californicus]|uniref:Uncharacterized protein n=1 Tax=Tigriopus californicus TaxID=6832 RepID=A0A553PKB1_TIGCA|nr:uncharacterized protein LOC131891049 [Tigriopus californicus]TRY78125.1 hypothetical protein TCAL_15296 [Tigriopus californicus]
MQYRCSEFVSSVDTSEPNCLIQITLGCKERLYPKFWKKEAFVWSTEKNEFRVDFTNWKQGQIFADGTYSYYLEDKYEITPESPFGLSVNSTFSFGAFQNMSFSTDSTATFQAFDFDGCPSYANICQSPPGELACEQENGQEPRIKCRNYVVSSSTNEKAKLIFECPEDCALQLEGQVISEPTLVYECDEPAHLWRNSSGQSLPTSLPTCDCPERGGGHLSSNSEVLSYGLPLIIGLTNFLQKQ